MKARNQTGVLEQPFRFESLRLDVRRLELAEALTTGSGTYHRRELAIVHTELRVDDQLVTGFGEAAPLPGWTDETVAGIRSIADSLPVGVDLASIGELDARLPELATRPVLRAGVEMAMLDALTRRQGRALASALAAGRGVAPLDRVPVQYTLGIADAGTCIERLRAAHAAGFGTAKLKVGTVDGDRELERIRTIARGCPHMNLRLDANGAWNVDQALSMAAALPAGRIEFIEQPVADPDLAELLARADRSAVTFAADESCAGYDRARALIRSGRVDWIVIKPSAVGGLLPAARLFELAGTRGVGIIVSNLMESAVGRSAIAQLAAAWPELPGPHGLATGSWFRADLAPEPDRIEAGRLVLRTGPGIGLRPLAGERR